MNILTYPHSNLFSDLFQHRFLQEGALCLLPAARHRSDVQLAPGARPAAPNFGAAAAGLPAAPQLGGAGDPLGAATRCAFLGFFWAWGITFWL